MRRTTQDLRIAAALALSGAGTVLAQPQPDPLEPKEAQAKRSTSPDVRSIAEEPRIHIRGSAWFTTLDGNVSVGDPFPGTITDIDFVDTLKLPEDRTVANGSVIFDLGAEQRIHLGLGYTGHFKYDGTSDPVSISFDNLVFTGAVDSHAKFDIAEAGVQFDVARPGPVTLAIGAATRVFFFEGSVTGTATNPRTGITATHTSSVDAVAPLPGIAGSVRWDMTDQFYVRGGGSGMYLGNYGNYFDAAAELGFDFTPNIGVFGGYRWMHAEADVSDVAFEVNLKGLFAGLEVRF